MYCTFWGLHWFWIMPIFFMIMMCICVAFIIRRTGGRRWSGVNRGAWGPFNWCNPGQDRMGRLWSETPQEILDQRYASGEITKEQYEQMKRDIESRPVQSGAIDD